MTELYAWSNIDDDDGGFDWNGLREAYSIICDRTPATLVYFGSSISDSADDSTPIQLPPRRIFPSPHVCSGGSCTFVNSGDSDVYLCLESARVHVCNEQVCDQCIHSHGQRICTFTHKTYELEDGIIFGYDNADRWNREFDDFYSCKGTSEPARDPGPIRRRRHRLHAPPSATSKCQVSLDAHSSVASPSIQPTPVSVVASKSTHRNRVHREYDDSSRESQRQVVVAQAGNYLCCLMSRRVEFTREVEIASSTLFDFHRSLITTVSNACRDVWAYISNTSAFARYVAQSEYKPEWHVIVVLVKMRTAGIRSVDGSTLAPILPPLTRLFDGPRDFTSKPFSLSTPKFTACEAILRKCLAERASVAASRG